MQRIMGQKIMWKLGKNGNVLTKILLQAALEVAI